MLFPQGLSGVIFDCDGVLLDSRQSNVLYYNRVLKHLGLSPMTLEQEEYTHMHTVRESLEYIVPENRKHDLEAAHRAVDYARDIVPAISLGKGAIECLTALQKAKIPLAVHTNRTTQAESVLERFGLLPFFSIVMTAKKAAPKPDPEGVWLILWEWDVKPETVLFVGDSILDYEASRAAGTRFAAFGNPHLAGDVHARDFMELNAWLAQYLPHSS